MHSGRLTPRIPTFSALANVTLTPALSSERERERREVVRQVRETGSVAVTTHSAVDMVLVDAGTYEQLTTHAAALKAREQSVLDQLAADFDRRLAGLQQPDASDKGERQVADRLAYYANYL